MTREVDLINHLPEVYKKIEEFQEIMKVESPVINSLWQNVQNIYDNSFILTSNDEGLDRRYRFLGMPIMPGEDLETRRFKILTRYQEQAPYTWRSLINLLNSLLGEGNYVLTRDVPNNEVRVKLELGIAAQYDALVDLLERIVPVSMNLFVELRYNTYGQLRPFTHAQLSAYTHENLREGVL